MPSSRMALIPLCVLSEHRLARNALCLNGGEITHCVPRALQIEELMNALEKTRQELDATKARLASTQQSLAEKEAHLANLRIERRKQLEEILEMK